MGNTDSTLNVRTCELYYLLLAKRGRLAENNTRFSNELVGALQYYSAKKEI